MARSASFGVGASPVQSIVQGARTYQRASGLAVPESGYGHVVMPQSVSRTIADAYDKLPDFDKRAVPAYNAMREETWRQYDHVTKPRSKGGMGMDVEITQHDPYGSKGADSIIPELRHDVTSNNRIQALSTAATGGHPIWDNDTNDAFRAVHDVFGHLGAGRGIDMHGEEAAYQKHSRMFSPLARQALATETRGQNQALHKHGSFQDQKVAILPQHMQGLQFGNRAPDLHSARLDARAENRKQGIG